jgi:hypothetical protein
MNARWKIVGQASRLSMTRELFLLALPNPGDGSWAPLGCQYCL